jgi:hypothetical protein
MLTIFLFCIAGVCATDVNDTQVGSEDNAAIELTDERLETSIDNNQVTEKSEPIIDEADNGTFTALQQKISNANENATIIFENDYIYDDGFE